MHNKVNLFRNQKAVSEIVGTMLLLGSAVVLFSVVYFSILSAPTPTQSPAFDVIANIEGRADDATIVVLHRGGDPVDANARFFVEIAGERESEKILKNYIVENDENEDLWNFGEQIKYYVGNVSGVKLDMGIIDIHSNSLVLMSALQEGYTVPPFGRGGIWHFNEDSGSVALDSSGNGNHGTIYGADRVNGMNGTNALSFDGLDDYVFVKDAPGISINGNITIEAWVNAKNLPKIINQTQFDVKFGYLPKIIKVNENIYAVVYRVGDNKNRDIKLATLKLLSDGWVVNSSINKSIVDSGGYEPNIVKVNSSCYAVIYGDKNGEGIIKTYIIDGSGRITYTGKSTSFSSNNCEVVSVSKVTDNVYSIAYGSSQKNVLNPGSVQIVMISDAGDITKLSDFSNFNAKCGNPDILQLGDNLFLIAYIDGTNLDSLMLETFFINATYGITKTSFSSTYSTSCVDPVIFKLSENVVGVVFTNSSNDGVLRTYFVSENGFINFTGNEFVFEGSVCANPDVMNLFEDMYGIAYEGKNHVGKIVKIKLLSNGTIKNVVSVENFVDKFGYEPNIFRISRHVFGIVFRENTPHPGGIATFSLYNDYGYSYQNAGIYKKDLYSLFANETHVVGGIGDVGISTMLDPGWQHIALTYNQSKIALYVNGSLKKDVSYSKSFMDNDEPLYIGDYFLGKMDEVAIYDHALTASEVKSHFDDPGTLVVQYSSK